MTKIIAFYFELNRFGVCVNIWKHSNRSKTVVKATITLIRQRQAKYQTVATLQYVPPRFFFERIIYCSSKLASLALRLSTISNMYKLF